MLNPQSLGLVRYFVDAYPVRTAAMVALLILAGLAEGIGIATLLPLMEVAAGGGAPGDERVSRMATGALDLLGLAPTLVPLLALVVLAIFAKGLFRWLAMREVGRAVATVAGDLRRRLLSAMMAVRWSYFADAPTGHFANAVSAEAFRASFAYRHACAALAALIQIAVYALVALLLSWKLAFIATLGGAVITFVLAGFVRASRRTGAEQTVVSRSLVTRITEVVHGMKPIKAMSREREFHAALERDNTTLQRAETRLVFAYESLQAFHEPVLALALAAGLFAAVTWSSAPAATLLVMALLFQRVITRFHALQTEYQGLVAGESAFWSLVQRARSAELQVEPTAVTPAPIPPPTLEQEIVFEGVSFAHEGMVVLRDVSLRIPAGEFVAIHGRSGVGKTTLVDLVIGLHRPAAGGIRIDGVPLERIDLRAWRRLVGYIPQETTLLHDSVANNVGYGIAGLPPETVEAALREAGAWSFVARLPNGVETVIGEQGHKLSGGERQRLAIARALVARPRLLVLDEATSALDARTEAEIWETLRALRGSITIIAVSHRRAVVDAADIVFEVEEGAIIEKTPRVPA